MIDLHYVERGRGRPLVLVPGWSQTTRCFAKQVDALADGHRVIAVDLRGHGESPKPPHGYRVARLAADLNEFLVRHDLDDVALAGHSMGASVIWSYLEQFGPGRLSRLVFIDQAPLVTNGCGLEGQALLEAGCAFTPETLYATANAIATERPAALAGLRGAFFSATVSDADFALVAAESAKIPADCAARLLVDHASQDWRDVITHLVPTLGLPVMVFGGALGTIFPPASQAWIAGRIPGARLSVFGADEGGSHFMFWENPDRFNAELGAFLAAT
ncbi:MAG: alpha/beta fold hydrolase [Gammaproteobacteria bacterium]